MESHVQNLWLHSRQEYRLYLFGESLDMEAVPPTARTLGMLAMGLALPAKMTPFEANMATNLKPRIATILAHHNESARATPEGLALFGWSGPEQAALVTSLTTDIINIWERAAVRRGVDRAFGNLPAGPMLLSDLQLRSVQMVIETAAAVCEALQAGYPTETEQDKADLAALLACYGPAYAFAVQQDGVGVRHVDFTGEAYQKWLQARGEYRQELFGDLEDSLLPPAQRRNSFLATIALKQGLGGYVNPHEQRGRITIAKNVDTILRHHDKRAHSEDMAIFGIADPRDISLVANLTAYTIWLWRRAVGRRNLIRKGSRIVGQPFELLVAEPIVSPDFTNPQVQMTIEVASAVIEVLQAGYQGGLYDSNILVDHHNSNLHGRLLAGLIAKRGPEYAKAWMAGEIIYRYGQEHQIDTQPWIDAVTKATLGRIAVEHPRNPIGKLQTIVRHLNTTLTRENLMHLTGWDEGRVTSVFTRSTLEWLAKTEQNPAAAAVRVAHHMDETLTTENLAAELDIPPARIKKLFPMWVRRSLAWRVSNPIEAARERAALCKRLEQGFPSLPILLIVRLVNEYPDSAETRAKNVVAEQNTGPRDVSKELWAWVVAAYPLSGDERRRKQLAAYRLLQSFRRPYSLDRGLPSGNSSYDIMAGSAPDPADVVTAQLPWQILRDVAQKAGVAADQLEALLDHYSHNQSLPDSTQLQAVLAQLQSVVKK